MKAKIIGKKDGFEVEVPAVYDPFFKTLAFGSVVVPLKEVGLYLNLIYGVDLVRVVPCEN
jgi:hypothetical protein